MNEFAEMLKEAFVGEEPFDARPGREALQASIRKYDARSASRPGRASNGSSPTKASFSICANSFMTASFQ